MNLIESPVRTRFHNLPITNCITLTDTVPQLYTIE